jgi:cold shock CspA family protein
MRQRFDDAVQHLCDVLAGNLSIQEVVPELLSEAKGMMNRCVREDQWDWFTVFSELGSPSRQVLRQIVSYLVSLRRATLAGDEEAYADCIRQLVSTEVLQLLHVYQNALSNQTFSEGAGWIYILSTREQPEILKIGRTVRSVAERVREINSATGILVPWAARRTYRVRNAPEAEAEIHRRLGEYRIRMDREFFDMPIGRAVEIIDAYLEESNQRDRWSGSILWFDKTRGFGFLSCAGHPDFFLHRSQLSREDQEAAEKGTPITFLLGRRPQGACAIDAKIVTAEKNNQ